ncbi:deoxyribodipyrimidine photo-lyase [Paraglaciecola sp. L3A3]|uniref:cryptochrome/photolyase family protein n=1 Tax=Paraglaciecola sp. L3A3 TaxID=2686358 RepID=UPI001E592B35|nr:deoxyribodipyrimidine photo-lyase [Paraglaciecola sp. L3A3]
MVWFRQDLRLRDNPALNYAAEQGSVLPLYIDDKTCPAAYQLGGASKWWLHHSLTSLNHSLDNQLHCQSGDAQQIILAWVKKHNITSVVWNRCYEPWQIKRDTAIKQALVDLGVAVKSFNASLLWEPWQVLKKDQTPYKVFTPYYRNGCLSQPNPRMPIAAPASLNIKYNKADDIGIETLNLLPDIPWDLQIQKMWQPGEQGASEKLKTFLPDGAHHYKAKRDMPSVTGTSQLSAHLHFGEISPNQIWYAGIHALNGNTENIGLDCYLSELGWREFSYYLLYHFPTLPEQNFSKKFEYFQWRTDPPALKAWQQGQTGIPIIDAGMRELWQTGTMHNRVRMLVASFLVKNLLVDWRQGAKWFWDCLLDADLAANSASWQWVAGTGADAAPYFRIFNPVTQGQKFDTEGEYVRQFCPELSQLPNKYIHNPWDASVDILRQANVSLGTTYPRPIADLKTTRQRALDTLSLSKQYLQPIK